MKRGESFCTWHLTSLILIIAFTLASCARSAKLSFDDYSSGEEWRIALLKQVPTGSSMNAVIDYLGKNGFLERADLGCDRYKLDDTDKTVKAEICESGFLANALWLVTFQFDDSKKLKDISVGLYP